MIDNYENEELAAILERTATNKVDAKEEAVNNPASIFEGWGCTYYIEGNFYYLEIPFGLNLEVSYVVREEMFLNSPDWKRDGTRTTAAFDVYRRPIQ